MPYAAQYSSARRLKPGRYISRTESEQDSYEPLVGQGLAQIQLGEEPARCGFAIDLEGS
jgi:hypothetical protein